MATTRIMPLHVGKGRTESRAISDIIDYVANPKKTDNGRLITGYACDSRTADAEFLLAKRQYIAATGRVRGADDSHLAAFKAINKMTVSVHILNNNSSQFRAVENIHHLVNARLHRLFQIIARQ